MKKKVYLAGGLKNPWRAQVLAALPADLVKNNVFFNPGDPELQQRPLQEIANLEVNWLYQTDIVFAFLEKDNPSGLGMSAEIGFGRAQGAYIIFVDHRADRYTAFLRCLADYSTESLEEGIAELLDCLQGTAENRRMYP